MCRHFTTITVGTSRHPIVGFYPISCRFLTTSIVGFSLLSGCASLTGPERIFTFSAAGATAGAIGGSALSPDKQNQGLNALVFGLTGALVGGVSGMLTDKGPTAIPKETPFFDGSTSSSASKDVTIAPYESLPDYVKKRLQPIVIEEFVEADQVDEDGVLRESHKAYRIKRQPEFNPKPLQKGVSNEGK